MSAELLKGIDHVIRMRHHRRQSVRTGVTVTVTRQVQGEGRRREGEIHGVKGVGILGAAMDKDNLRSAVTEAQETQRSTIGQRDRASTHDGRVCGKAPLGSVLMKKGEFVVVHMPHARIVEGDELLKKCRE